MNESSCLFQLFVLVGFVLSAVAFARSRRSGPARTMEEMQDAIARTAREIDRVWTAVRSLEASVAELRAGKPSAEASPLPVPLPAARTAPEPFSVPPPVVHAAAPVAPRPVTPPPAPPPPAPPPPAAPPAPVVELPKPLELPVAEEKPPVVPPPLPAAPVPAAPPRPQFSAMVQKEEAAAPEAPKPAVTVAAAVPAVVPAAVPAVVPAAVPVPVPAPVPAPVLRPALPPVPPPIHVEKKKRNLEDFLGTQLFLKAGVAILVIGVVFAMGLVFQKLGPAGKLAMGYLGGLGMLAGGLFAERNPTYKTFGRAIIAGAWGILYFVTYAGGFIEASKVFPSEPVAIVAMLIAAAAAVAFSLRYRNEWTTTSAFLLIFLGLGMAAWDLEPTFNLTSTAIVALAMAVLVWRTGWVRLLGLGVPATWATLTFWIIRRPHMAGDAALLGTLLLCWAAFQLVLVFFDGEEEREKWIGLSQIGNFLGGFGLCLYQTHSGGQSWVWAAGFGAANLLVAWAYARRGRRTMYLLAASEAIAALALVTPLRLGWKHQLTPVYRMVGIELLLVGGVLLKEKYFRRIAYAAFLLALIEIVALKLDPALGTGRTLLLGAATGIWLLDALLLRTVWKEVLEDSEDALSERTAAPTWFAVAGTLTAAILIWIEAPLKLYGALYAALALLWLGLGWLRGYKDALALAPLLGLMASACAIWALFAIPGAPGTVPARWIGSAAASLLLAAGVALTHRTAHEGLAEDWTAIVRATFGVAALGVAWAWLFRELPATWTATGFAGLAAVLLASALASSRRGLSLGAFFTFAASLALLLLRPAETNHVFWHLTLRGWSVLSVAAAAFGMEALVRSDRGRDLLTEAGGSAFRWTTSLAGLVLLVFVVCTEPPHAWRPVGIAALAVVHLGFGLWKQYRDRAVEALILLGGALLLLVLDPAPNGSGAWHISHQGWSLIGVGALTFGFEWMVRRPASEPLFSRGLRAVVLPAVSCAALALVCHALYRELPRPWIAVGLGGWALLCLLLGLLWSHREKAYASLAILAFSLFVLATRPAAAVAGLWQLRVDSWTLLGVASLAFAMEYVLRRERTDALFGDVGRTQKLATLYVSLTALVLGVLVVFMEVPKPWIAVTIAALAALHLGLGMLWSHQDRAYESFALLMLSLTVLWLQPATMAVVRAHVSVHGWTLLGVAAAALLMEVMVRLRAAERVFDAREKQAALWVFSLTGTALALLTIWTEAPDAWIAPLMSALSVLLLVLGLLLGFQQQIVTSTLTGLAGLAAVAFLGPRYHGEWLQVSIRAWNLGLLAGLSLGQELILRFWRKAWIWSEASFHRLAGGHSIKAVLLLGALVVVEFRTVWVPGSLMLLAILWMFWARKRPSVLHAGEACVFALAAFLAMLSMLLLAGEPLPEVMFGIPERILFHGFGILLAYGFQRELHLAVLEPADLPDRLNTRVGLGPLALACLLVTTLFLAAVVRIEAGHYQRIEWVALIWGAAALLYFERGRWLKQSMWTVHGHALVAIAFLQLLAANLPADRLYHDVSWRVWSCVPFIGMLFGCYGFWKRIHVEAVLEQHPLLRTGYLYAGQIALAALLLFELKRPWVLAAWAVQALATLLIGLRGRRVPWLRVASLLAVLAGARGLVENLYHWDAFVLGGENLVAMPLAWAALLAGYALLRTADLKTGVGDAFETHRALLDGRHRMPWFVLQAALLFAFIWMEAAGKSLTMWLTIYGFGMVGLGFLFRERSARLLGLGVLSACTLKLFLWDLRGLQGLARVGSFIILGIVLITVSFVYTRFKERMGRLL